MTNPQRKTEPHTNRPRRRGYRGLSAEELDRQRHERILGAALVLFGQNGFNSTRIDRICAQARVSTRHFYEQFESRGAVLAAVHDQIIATLAEEMRSALTQHGRELTQRLGAAIENTVYRLLSEPGKARILCIESVGVSPDMEELRRAAMREAVALVRRYTELMVRRNKLPNREHYLTAVGLVGLLNELVVEWLNEPTGLTTAQMAANARDMFLAMLFHS